MTLPHQRETPDSLLDTESINASSVLYHEGRGAIWIIAEEGMDMSGVVRP